MNEAWGRQHLHLDNELACRCGQPESMLTASVRTPVRWKRVCATADGDMIQCVHKKTHDTSENRKHLAIIDP